MKIFNISIIILLTTLSAWAQRTQWDQIVTMDDSVHTGQVIEQKPGVYIKLLTRSTNDTATFLMDEIKHLKKVFDEAVHEPVKLTDESTKEVRTISPFVSYAQGGGDENFVGLGIGFNYRFNRAFSMGLKVQYFGDPSRDNRPVHWQKIPVSLSTTYKLAEFPKSKSAFYIRNDIGYSFTLNGDYSDQGVSGYKVSNGLYLNPGLGYEINVFKNMGLYLDLSYCLIQQKTMLDDQILRRQNVDNAMLTVGMFF